MATDKDIVLYNNLRRAMEQNRIADVEKLMTENKIDPNKKVVGYATPLEHAVLSGNPEAIKLIISKGGNVNQRGDGSFADRISRAPAPIHIARNSESLKVLIDAGADVNAKFTNTDKISGVTPLHQAVIKGDVEMVNTLVKAGANVNDRDGVGFTPAHRAAAESRTQHLLDTLKSHGADMSIRTKGSERTPEELASAVNARNSQNTQPKETEAQIKGMEAASNRQSQERLNQLNTEHNAQTDFEKLSSSIEGRLAKTDWDAARPPFPKVQSPMLGEKMYEDIDKLAKQDFEKAAQLWEKYAPKEAPAPISVSRLHQEQMQGLAAVTKVLNEASISPDLSKQEGKAAPVAEATAKAQTDFEKLSSSIEGRLAKTDWDAARPPFSKVQPPMLGEKMYEDIDKLAKQDFEKAAQLWEKYAPKEAPAPISVSRLHQEQMQGLAAVTKVLNEASISPDLSKQEGKAAPVAEATAKAAPVAEATAKAAPVAEAADKAAPVAESADKAAQEMVTTPEPGHIGSVTNQPEAVASEKAAPESEPNQIEPAEKTQEASKDGNQLDSALKEIELAAQAVSKAAETARLAELQKDRTQANDSQERNTGTANREDENLAGRQKENSAELMAQVRSEFRESGNKYHYRSGQGAGDVAFKDAGSKLTSAKNDEKVAEAMVKVAEAKNWDAIKVKGHPEFKAEVWLAASLRGIEVKGYTPTKEDLQRLEDKRDKSMHNVVEKDTSRAQTKQPEADKAKLAEPPKTKEADLTPRAKVAEAVATALISARVPESQRQALQEAIRSRLTERSQSNTVPQVAMYDKASQSKSVQQDRAQPAVEQTTDRGR